MNILSLSLEASSKKVIWVWWMGRRGRHDIHFNMEITAHMFRLSLLDIFIVLHSVVHIKHYKNKWKESKRELKPCHSSHLNTSSQSESEVDVNVKPPILESYRDCWAQLTQVWCWKGVKGGGFWNYCTNWQTFMTEYTGAFQDFHFNSHLLLTSSITLQPTFSSFQCLNFEQYFMNRSLFCLCCAHMRTHLAINKM